MVEEPLKSSAGRGGVVRPQSADGVSPASRLSLEDIPGILPLVRLLFNRIAGPPLKSGMEALRWLGGGKVRISIAVGVCAGLVVAFGFALFDIQKEEWILEQKYPEAISSYDRNVLYVRELIDEHEHPKAERILRRLVEAQRETDNHATALLLLARCLEEGDKSRNAAEETRMLCERFIEEYPADPRVPSAHMMIAESFAKDELYEESNERYQKLLRIISDTGARAEVEFLIAQNYYAVKRLSEATAAFERIRQRYPDSSVGWDSLLMLARIGVESGKYDDANRTLDRLIADAPGTTHAAAALKMRAENAMHAGNYDAAITYCVRWLKESPSTRHQADVMLIFARANLEAGIPADALAIASDVARNFPDSPHFVEALVLRGKALEALGRPEEALQEYADAIRAFPHEPSPHEGIAKLYRSEGNYSAAIKHMEWACVMAPKEDSLQIALAKLYRLNGENVKALAVLEKFSRERQLSVQLWEAFQMLVDTYQQLGRTHEAYDTLTRMLTVAGTPAQEAIVYEKRAEMLTESGLYKEANENYRLASKAGANAGDMKTKIARNLLETGGAQVCLSELDSIEHASLDSQQKIEFLELKARALIELESVDEARRVIQDALVLPEGKEKISLLALLMQTNLALQDEKAASKIFESTLKLTRTNEKDIPSGVRRIILDWAGYLYQKGDYARALGAYSAIDGSPFPAGDVAWALYQRGNCYYHMADYDRASESYSRLASEHSDSEWVTFARQKKELIEIMSGT